MFNIFILIKKNVENDKKNKIVLFPLINLQQELIRKKKVTRQKSKPFFFLETDVKTKQKKSFQKIK